MEENKNKNSFIILEDKKITVKKSHHRLLKKTTDSAVAIPISSVSHHHFINQNQGSSLEIIVAEDNELSYMILKFILEQLDVHIHHAQNGIEVVEMVRSIPHIDLILMDIKMPLMNGIEATRQVKKIIPGMPVIAQSIFHDDSDILSSFQAGCDDFISKPINSSLLLSKIIFWNF
jgi:CheY-like chemotaxis protein